MTCSTDFIRAASARGLLRPGHRHQERDMIRYYKRRIVNKASSYTVSPTKGDYSGTIFTTRGAGAAVTFTLPTPTANLKDTSYDFVNVAGQNMIVSAGSGKAVTFNNLAATSLAASTAGQLIGALITATCDGTSWILFGESNGVTYTVA